MQLRNPEDLLIEELRAIYSAEKQLMRALPKLQKSATSEALQDAIAKRREDGGLILELIDAGFEELEARPGRKKNHAMEGLIEETNALAEDIQDEAMLDAAMLGALQKVEHYCIASWGTAAALAKTFGHTELAERLSRTIDEGRERDEALTQLAEEEVNAALADSEDADEDQDDEGEEARAAPRKSAPKRPAKKAARAEAPRG